MRQTLYSVEARPRAPLSFSAAATSCGPVQPSTMDARWTAQGHRTQVASFCFLAAFFSSLLCPSPPLIKRPLKKTTKKRRALTVVESLVERKQWRGKHPADGVRRFFYHLLLSAGRLLSSCFSFLMQDLTLRREREKASDSRRGRLTLNCPASPLPEHALLVCVLGGLFGGCSWQRVGSLVCVPLPPYLGLSFPLVPASTMVLPCDFSLSLPALSAPARLPVPILASLPLSLGGASRSGSPRMPLVVRLRSAHAMSLLA